MFTSSYNRIDVKIKFNFKALFESIRQFLIFDKDNYDNAMFYRFLIYAINHEQMHYILHKEEGEAVSIAFDNLYKDGIDLNDAFYKMYGGV